MKACKHFSRGKETYISPSEGHLWNSWIEVYDVNGNLVSSSFEAGLRAEYFEHLLENEKCRQSIKVSKQIIQEELKEINAEWKEVTGE